jgi:hypothetical protein
MIPTNILAGAGAFALATMIAAPAFAEGNGNLNLLCMGQGEVLTTQSKNELVWDRYDHKYRSRSSLGSAMSQFDSAVTIQISGDDGRIRLPKKLIPPINSGGDDQHWWQLTDIRMGSNEIDASYRLNGLNKPKVKIDRTTGLISIKGTGQDFSGRCDVVDPDQKRF